MAAAGKREAEVVCVCVSRDGMMFPQAVAEGRGESKNEWTPLALSELKPNIYGIVRPSTLYRLHFARLLGVAGTVLGLVGDDPYGHNIYKQLVLLLLYKKMKIEVLYMSPQEKVRPVKVIIMKL